MAKLRVGLVVVLSFLTARALERLKQAAMQPESSLAPPIFRVSDAQWASLNASVTGRLHNNGRPFAAPCYNGETNSTKCSDIRQGYQDHLLRSSQFGAYMHPSWEGCQVQSQFCLLDHRNTSNTPSSSQCHQGSVPSWYIDVRVPEDVSAAYDFARRTRVPLVIKNTGHDYRGRSSRRNSLALWTRNLQEMTFHQHFIPEGCSIQKRQVAVSVGAGVVFDSVYKFADQHGVTVIGGTDESVGISGGWVLGGGHSVLSPTLGLGADRVLQFKIVTPDGIYRVANACQHRDLFYALRGGGGGTFGVVIESTFAAAPKLTLQVAHFTFPKSRDATREAWRILIDHAIPWSAQGFSSYISPGAATMVTPLLNRSSVVEAMFPLLNFTRTASKNAPGSASSLIVQFPSYYSLYTAFIKPHQAVVGVPHVLSSRLIPKDNFLTPYKREELLDALMDASSSSFSPRLLGVTPVLYQDDGGTSVHPSWRTAIWHVLLPVAWDLNASPADIKAAYNRSSNAANAIKNITPSAGVYQNEADVYTVDPKSDFWGPHYPALLRIKKKYDPHSLLDCWQCIGWKGPADDNYSCYLK